MNIFLKDKPQAGIVGVGNSHKGISAFLQHRVAGAGTHAFIIDYPDGTQKQFPRVFESDMRVSYALWTTYLKDKDFDFWLYEVVGATTAEIDYALDKCKEKFLGDIYGFLEWPYFLWQMFCRKVLKIDVRKNKNWITGGTICTELFYWYLWYLTEIHPENWIKLKSLLEQWSADAMTANDALHLLHDHPECFRLVMQKLTGGT
jgi:hypothetical protein